MRYWVIPINLTNKVLLSSQALGDCSVAVDNNLSLSPINVPGLFWNVREGRQIRPYISSLIHENQQLFRSLTTLCRLCTRSFHMCNTHFYKYVLNKRDSHTHTLTHTLQRILIYYCKPIFPKVVIGGTHEAERPTGVGTNK